VQTFCAAKLAQAVGVPEHVMLPPLPLQVQPAAPQPWADVYVLHAFAVPEQLATAGLQPPAAAHCAALS
jgi:hypothetical protein